MSVGDFATWSAIAVSVVVGVVGWIFAGVANRSAKKANELAEASNRIASQAQAEAAAANKIAEDANELSQQANALSERAFLHETEESFVQWLPEWDADRVVLSLVNRGRDRAVQPSVVVTGQELHQVARGQDTAAGEKVEVSLPQIVEKRLGRPSVRYGTVGGRTIAIAAEFAFSLDIVVLWKTERGFQRTERLEFQIREGKGKGTISHP